jgi:MoaA/NifB/PqqE/SkfB family radical SAM enzyme
MNVYAEQSDNDHLVQRLYIQWDIHKLCPMKCSYCYLRFEKNKPLAFSNNRINTTILLALSKAKLPIFIGLAGGEPTLSKDYFFILDELNFIMQRNKNNKFHVTTNGIRLPNWWREHKYYDNLYLLWSFHPEYAFKNNSYISNFLENVDIMLNKNIKTKVNIMLIDDPKYWPLLKDIYYKLKIKYIYNQNFELHPHYLYVNNSHELYNYSDEFWQFWKFLENETNKQYKFIDKDNNTYYYNEYEIFKYKINNFKNWQCYHNNFEIDPNGNVFQYCLNEQDNLITNNNYFANIDKIINHTCIYNSCNCDGLLKIYKKKEK